MASIPPRALDECSAIIEFALTWVERDGTDAAAEGVTAEGYELGIGRHGEPTT